MSTSNWQAISNEIHSLDRAGILIDTILTDDAVFPHATPVIVSSNLDNHFRKAVFCAATGALIAETHINDLSKIVALASR